MTKFFVKFFRVIRNKKVMKYVPKDSRVLDVGCGGGFYLLDMTKNKIKSGVGIDMAVKNIKSGNITIKNVKVFDKLNFPSKSFDVTTMIAFIEHIDKPEKILHECNRVLTKGGIIIITTPMAMAKPFWELLVNFGLTEEKTTEDHKHYFSPDEIEKLLKKTGFRVLVSKKFELGMNYIAVGKKN